MTTFIDKAKVHGLNTAERNAKSQRERFEEAAREQGVDLDEEKLKEAFRKMGL